MIYQIWDSPGGFGDSTAGCRRFCLRHRRALAKEQEAHGGATIGGLAKGEW